MKSFNLNLLIVPDDTISQTVLVGRYLMHDGESLNIFKNGKAYSFQHYCDANGVIHQSKSYKRNDVLNAAVRYLCANTFPSKLAR